MSDRNKFGSWFVMKNYNPNDEKIQEFGDNSINVFIDKQNEKLEELGRFIESLADKVEIIEDKLEKLMQSTKIEEIDIKLDKLIQSNKSLLQYFGSIHERDIRDLNYRIRGYASKNMSPINFVPHRSQKNL